MDVNNEFKVKVKIEDDPAEYAMLTVQERDYNVSDEMPDGWYVYSSRGDDGFWLFERNTDLCKRDVRQLINKKFNLDYGGDPEKLLE